MRFQFRRTDLRERPIGFKRPFRWGRILVAIILFGLASHFSQSLLQAQVLRPLTNQRQANSTDQQQLAAEFWSRVAGSWKCQRAEVGGQPFPAALVEQMSIQFARSGNEVKTGQFLSQNAVGEDRGRLKWVAAVPGDNTADEVMYRIVLVSSPDTTVEKRVRAIARFSADGEQLEVCCSEGEFPRRFGSDAESSQFQVVYRRASTAGK